jgi:hypothetical protein
MKSNAGHIESELKNKIFYLQKALTECSDIMDKLKTENELLKEDCEKILSTDILDPNLSKIRGD